MRVDFVHEFGRGKTLTFGRSQVLSVLARIPLDRRASGFDQGKMDSLVAAAEDFRRQNDLSKVVLAQGGL